jgi:hypothetical protein
MSNEQSKDLRALRLVFALVFAVVSVFIAVERCRAVIIEGFTETGGFSSVYVSANGELRVQGSTSIAMAVFFISSQPVNAFQAGVWTVGQQTAATLNNSCVAMPAGGAPTLLLAAGATRKGHLICNDDATLNAWVGNGSVNGANTPTLYPGACVTLDDGTLYTGPLYGYTTAALNLCIYEKQP